MTVLIAPDKTTLVAFGYEAENKYEELIQKHKQKDYFYFPNFGLSLREDFKKVKHQVDIFHQTIILLSETYTRNRLHSHYLPGFVYIPEWLMLRRYGYDKVSFVINKNNLYKML